MRRDVFISYSSKDKSVADAVCAALEDARISCWIAPRDVQPGRPFSGEITRAIGDAKILVLIYSAYANESHQVLREVQLATDNHLHIVQFRIEAISPSDDLKYYLSSPHWLDAMTPPLDQHIEKLVAAVKALVAVHDEQSPDLLPSHSSIAEVELTDATLFSATVNLSSAPDSKREFFQRLRPLLRNFLAEKADDVIESMVERETILSTGGGFGLGFPHGYRPYITRFVTGVVSVPGGCDWHASDDQPVFTVLPYVGGGGGRTTQALRIMGSAHKAVTKILSSTGSGPPDGDTVKRIIETVKSSLVQGGLSVGVVSFP
jgi:mannitol/fructose-specific phosphotransferase system IIA component